MVGTPQRRIDALEAVTGRKQFAMDLDVPGALPTMLCRPPTINATALSVKNAAEVKAMPGVTDVAIIPHTNFVAGGVAVRAATFGQCIDAVRALDVVWGPGSVDGKSDADVLADLKAAELPMTPALGPSIDQRFTFYFRPGDPLETNCAVADVRPDGAEIWSCLKTPAWVKEQLAELLGLPLNSVTVHVTQGGGSFGRHLFADAAFEAAATSKALGKPVKLIWRRTDNFRQGRVHPIAPRASGSPIWRATCSRSTSATPAWPRTSPMAWGTVVGDRWEHPRGRLPGLLAEHLHAILEISRISIALQPQTLEIVKIAIFLFGTYLGTIMTLRAADELYVSIPFVKFAPIAQKKKDLIIDSSVLSDARIIDVAATGLFDHQLILPRFIIKDLYAQAEIGDEFKKQSAPLPRCD